MYEWQTVVTPVGEVNSTLDRLIANGWSYVCGHTETEAGRAPTVHMVLRRKHKLNTEKTDPSNLGTTAT